VLRLGEPTVMVEDSPAGEFSMVMTFSGHDSLALQDNLGVALTLAQPRHSEVIDASADRR
jgi:hypothetical protein